MIGFSSTIAVTKDRFPGSPNAGVAVGLRRRTCRSLAARCSTIGRVSKEIRRGADGDCCALARVKLPMAQVRTLATVTRIIGLLSSGIRLLGIAVRNCIGVVTAVCLVETRPACPWRQAAYEL